MPKDSKLKDSDIMALVVLIGEILGGIVVILSLLLGMGDFD